MKICSLQDSRDRFVRFCILFEIPAPYPVSRNEKEHWNEKQRDSGKVLFAKQVGDKVATLFQRILIRGRFNPILGDWENDTGGK